MNKFIATFLVGLLSFTATAVLNPVDQQKFVYQNLLANPGFENGAASWTASGGATKTANTTAKGTLSYGYDFDSNSAAQTVSSETITIPNGLLGQNGVAFCGVKTPSGTATHNLEVFDGTNVIASVAVTTSSTRFANAITNFVFPTSGTVVLRIKSVASNEPEIYIDDCYIGLANNISTSTNVTDWVDYTLTIGASTTPPTQGAGATKTARWRRVGGNMEVQFTYAQTAAGTAGSGVYLFPLPSGGYTIDTTKVTVSTTGNGAGGTVVGVGQAAFTTTGGANYASDLDVIPYNTTNFQLIAQTGPFGPAQGNVSSSTYQLSNNPTYYSFSASVPIVGWSAEPAFRPDLAAQSWSGKITSTADWTTTSTSFVDVSVTSASTFTEVTNTNFGTVTQYKSGATEYPGFTFTPTRTGNYLVCFSGAIKNSNSSNVTYVKLTDGTNDITQPQDFVPISGGVSSTVSNCGILPVTNLSTKNIRLQIKAGAFTAAINTGTTIPLGFSIAAIANGYPAPILLGSVTSKSTTAEGIERVTFGGATEGTNNCTSSPCTIYRSSAGISSVTRSATGIYVINFVSGAFSAAPTCVANGIIMGTGTGTFSQSTVTNPTSTTFNLNSKNPSSIDADGGNINVVCMGPK